MKYLQNIFSLPELAMVDADIFIVQRQKTVCCIKLKGPDSARAHCQSTTALTQMDRYNLIHNHTHMEYTWRKHFLVLKNHKKRKAPSIVVYTETPLDLCIEYRPQLSLLLIIPLSVKLTI